MLVEVFLMQENFLEKFIKKEMYLQNEPLKTKDFIDFCKKRGIKTNEYELEFFEKEGLLYPIIRIMRPPGEEEWIKFYDSNGEKKCRPASYGLLEGEKEIERYPIKYYSQYEFNSRFNEYLLNWLEEGNLFDPSTKPFKEWSSFKGEELNYDSEKIVSFYSSFQLHWLIILKKSYSINIDLAGGKTFVSSSLERLNGRTVHTSFTIDNFDELEPKLKEVSKESLFGEFVFDFEKKKEELLKMHQNFEKVLEFLISIQSIYVPYGKSSSKTITYHNEGWHEKRNKFDPKKELDELRVNMEEIEAMYYLFSKRIMDIFGVKRDDWIQLWKSIAWAEKNELEGDARLGIEYLQWALMLKRFIEDYCGREILDIDEMSNISPNDILKFNPPEMDQYGMLLRASRNKRYFDPEENKSYFKDKYKRLFYLANDFDLNYQPRIMVFVEGKTEEDMFPVIFKWFYNKPENLGIEFVNFKGVDKLLSTSKNARELKRLIEELQAELCAPIFKSNSQNKKLSRLIRDLKKTDIVISNWTSFISYNLEKWQILPFFVSDDEGNVRHFLDSGKPINFKNENYDIPNDWKYLWGVTNNNQPFKGNNFEFANFSDEEIVLAMNKVLRDEINIEKVKEVRKRGEGIKKVDDQLLESQNKRKVVKILFDNLFKLYEETQDDSILERPIFKLMVKILDVSRFNHPPVDRNIEIMNKEYILDILVGKN